MSLLIDKKNFIINTRREEETAVIPLFRRATQYLDKIFLPSGNPDFDQFLRYFSSMYLKIRFRRRAWNLMQNQDFNLVKIFI